MITLNSRLQTTLQQLKSTQTLPGNVSKEEINKEQAQVLDGFTRMPLDTFRQFDNCKLDQDPRPGFMSRETGEPGRSRIFKSEMAEVGDTTVMLETMIDPATQFTSTKYYEVGPGKTISLVDYESPGNDPHTDAVYLDAGTESYLIFRG